MNPERHDVRFIADAMLGRLARWLRFLGFDTLYYHDITDSRLVKIGREQGRLILTRDTRLTERKGLKDFLLIHANDSLQQLHEVIDHLALRHFQPLSRCVKCNGQLLYISKKSEIKDSVPEHIFIRHNDFFRCRDCGKIYWEGSHPKKLREKLIHILKQG